MVTQRSLAEANLRTTRLSIMLGQRPGGSGGAGGSPSRSSPSAHKNRLEIGGARSCSGSPAAVALQLEVSTWRERIRLIQRPDREGLDSRSKNCLVDEENEKGKNGKEKKKKNEKQQETEREERCIGWEPGDSSAEMMLKLERAALEQDHIEALIDATVLDCRRELGELEQQIGRAECERNDLREALRKSEASLAQARQDMHALKEMAAAALDVDRQREEVECTYAAAKESRRTGGIRWAVLRSSIVEREEELKKLFLEVHAQEGLLLRARGRLETKPRARLAWARQSVASLELRLIEARAENDSKLACLRNAEAADAGAQVMEEISRCVQAAYEVRSNAGNLNEMRARALSESRENERKVEEGILRVIAEDGKCAREAVSRLKASRQSQVEDAAPLMRLAADRRVRELETANERMERQRGHAGRMKDLQYRLSRARVDAKAAHGRARDARNLCEDVEEDSLKLIECLQCVYTADLFTGWASSSSASARERAPRAAQGIKNPRTRQHALRLQRHLCQSISGEIDWGFDP